MADQSTYATLNYGDREAPLEFPDRHTKVHIAIRDGRYHGKTCDSRGLAAQLDTAGFSLVTDCPVVSSGLVKSATELQDAEFVDSKYMSFLQSYFKRVMGCHHVHPINYVHRKSGTDHALPEGLTQTLPIQGATTGAIANVHADFADQALLVQTMRRMLKDDEEIRGGRFVLVNCWRPLETVRRWPLAVCDAASVVDDEDLYPRKNPEIPNTVSNCFPERAVDGKHEWYFFPSMSPEELIVFKQWDEDTSMRQQNPTVSDAKLRGVARQTLHSSFNLEAPPDAPARWSLEARFACIWKPKPSSRL